MWVIEGRFRDLEGSNTKNEESERRRWLRPSRVYSLGRESVNDFSLELPRTLSRVRGLELDVGSWRSNTEEISSDNSKPYPLTITNYDNKTRFILREDQPAITIKSQASTNIESGDEIASEASDTSIRFAKFSWNPINICYSALSVSKRASILNDLQDAGFSFSEARFPSKENTHFLPKPLKPTLPIGYALVEGIQLISEAWLDELLVMTRLKPLLEPIKSSNNALKRKDNESDQAYEQRVRLKESLQKSRSKGFSEFEIDYQSAWQKLEGLNINLPRTTLNLDFKRWLQDPIKLNPNPNRKTLFSNVNVILLANENDDNANNIEQILQAGQATISTIYTTGDDSRSLEQQLQKSLSQQTTSKDIILMKTPLFTGSLTNIKGNTIKTVNDLLNAIYDLDISNLVQDQTLIKNLCSTSTPLVSSEELTSSVLSANQEKTAKASMVLAESSTHNDDSSIPNSQIGRPKLIRRADSRTDAVRMKELERLMGPITSKVESSELETLKMYAKMDDLSADQSTICENRNPTSAAAHGENSHDKVSTPNSDMPVRSPSPPVIKHKPLLKRKNRDRNDLDINRYMPFLTEDVTETPASVEQETPQLGTNTYSTKRQKLGDSSQLGSANTEVPKEDFDINKIEGPVTQMLKADAQETQNALKRKASVYLSADEDNEPTYQTGKHARQSKRERLDMQTGLREPDSGTSDPEVMIVTHDTAVKRKRGPRSNELESDGKIKPQLSKGETEKTSDEKEENYTDLYLTVKTKGKRLTAEEVESNLEFNRLQISKTPALLKNKLIPTRSIGWDEEDQSENELREIDNWDRDQKINKSFFKVKYVNLVNKHKQDSSLIWQDSSTTALLPNFKKFIPKNRGLHHSSETPSHPSQRRNKIKMETVRFNESVGDRERMKSTREPNPTRVSSKQFDQDDEEAERESQRQDATTRSQKKTTSTSNQQGHHPLSDNSSSSSLEFNPPPPSSTSLNKDQKKNTLKSTPFASSDSDHLLHHQKSKTPATTTTATKKFTQTKIQNLQKTTRIPQTTQSTSRLAKKTPVHHLDDDDSSDGDELAFKGFGRRS